MVFRMGFRHHAPVLAVLLSFLVSVGADGGTSAAASARVHAKVLTALKKDKAPSSKDIVALDPKCVATAEIAQDPAVPAKTRVRAASIWIECVPSVASTGLAVLKTLLDDPDAEVRKASGHAVARLGTAEARDALQARLDSEPDPAVRADLELDLARATP